MRVLRPPFSWFSPITVLVAWTALAALACSSQSASAPAPDAKPEEKGTAPATRQQPVGSKASDGAGLHHGIDVSSYSGEVDWAKVREEGHTFAFLKATEGDDLADPSFAQQWPKIKEAGLIRGAYHFYVTEDDPEKQASFFIKTVQLVSGDLAPVVDIELIGKNTPAGLAERLKIFTTRLEEHYGVKPIIYTAPDFWDEHLGEGFGDHPLWVAEYETDQPRLPVGWSDWHLWQWQGDAKVPGVAGSADLSKVNRVGVDLSILLIPE